MHSDRCSSWAHWSVYKTLYSPLYSLQFFINLFIFFQLHSCLFPSVLLCFFCSYPLKIPTSIFSFKERQIKVVLSSSCLNVWLTWRNHYSLILGGCLVKRAIHNEFYSGWYKSTFKDYILHDSIVCEIFLILSIYFCHC